MSKEGHKLKRANILERMLKKTFSKISNLILLTSFMNAIARREALWQIDESGHVIH